ncbi:hypothetical protein TRICI_004260 [Trichomonascus ciferrii]|uniref:Alpha/beta hydrolase fold-3 domain-containing protein n=1 Tax=Trichomonascus ciferrii TaxID=44093 RepID=A0A642V6E7_9ASCO|nr:hypothetical protein TRICI_004260 [Trichomonascus ciferrii]
MSSDELPVPPFTIDPSVKDRLDPEYVEFFEKNLAPEGGKNLLFTHLVPLDVVRAGGNVMPGQSPLLEVGSTKDISIPRELYKGPAVPVRVFTPKGEPPAGGWPCTIWFHGGGWVLGGIDTENSFCTHVCEWSKSVVVSVDYRMAPENPFPAAIEDSYEALIWILKNAASLGINATKVAVAGSSAGGNISAILTHKYANDSAHQDLPSLVYQLLVVPVCDNTADKDTHLSWKEFEHTPQLPRGKMLWYRDLYLPNKADWKKPEASPIFYPAESFKKVPPAFVACGECDVLRTEGEQYAEKLKQAGIETNLTVYPGMPHPVMAMDDCLTQGKRLVKETTDALRNAFY